MAVMLWLVTRKSRLENVWRSGTAERTVRETEDNERLQTTHSVKSVRLPATGMRAVFSLLSLSFHFQVLERLFAHRSTRPRKRGSRLRPCLPALLAGRLAADASLFSGYKKLSELTTTEGC